MWLARDAFNCAICCGCPGRERLWKAEQLLLWPAAVFSTRSLNSILSVFLLTTANIDDDILRTWWAAFARGGLALPDGRRWQEHQLTIPAGDHFLTGRFDLLIVSESEEEVSAHLYDWKTSRPRSTAQLRLDWQTRLYLAMLAESGSALTMGKRPLSRRRAGHDLLVYRRSRRAAHHPLYDGNASRGVDRALAALVERISRHLHDNAWPLTGDISQCRSCPYQVICGRQSAGYVAAPDDDELDAGQSIDERLVEPYTP